MEVSPEVQRICSMFHFGWIPKKDVGILERDFDLYRQVEESISVMGYELVNTPEWYVVRLKKKYDTDSFNQFYSRNRDISKMHLAMINILYVKLILPKKYGHVDANSELYITLDELILNYGSKFQTKRYDPKKKITQIMKTVKKYAYIIQPIVGIHKYYPGPMLYALRDDLLNKTFEVIVKGLVDDISQSAQLDEAEEEDLND